MAFPTFQPATPGQLEEVMEFVRRYYTEDQIAFDEALIRPALVRLLTEPALGRAFIIVGEENVSAGYVIFTFGFDHEAGGLLATVTDLFIVPERRGRGFGRAALSFVAKTCRSLDVRGLELQVETHNTAGQTLYRSFGFRAQSRIAMFLPLGGDKYDR